MEIEEAKKMEGTEFTYIFEDGDTIQAYVKKFDQKVGLTCLSLTTQTKDGWKPNDKEFIEADGTFCVIGARSIPKCMAILEGIKEKGYHTQENNGLGNFLGCVFS